MKTNKIIISALVSFMAAGVMAQVSDKTLYEMNIDTDEYNYDGKSFYTADIDSIVFGGSAWEYYPWMQINGRATNGEVRRPSFSVLDIHNIMFTTCDSRKLYAPKFTYGVTLTEGSRGNSIKLGWEPVEGAVGYELKYCRASRLPDTSVGTVDFWGNGEFELWLNGQHPDNDAPVELPADGGVMTFDAGTTDIELDGLHYYTRYFFAVRALSPDGEEYNSDWSIRKDMRRYFNFALYTEYRYPVPKILSCVSREENTVRIGFDLSYEAHKTEEYWHTFSDNFEIVDGNFVADELRVSSSLANRVPVDEKWVNYKLTPEDIENGYIDVTGLQAASGYTFTLVNTNISSLPDAKYNSITAFTKGTTVPVLIPHEADPATGEYAACDLVPYINTDSDYGQSPCQTFYLEGDKAYYLSTMAVLSNGLTLETLPEDVAAGKRAKVYLGGIISENGTLRTSNFMIAFSGGDSELLMDPITFRNIDFDCPEACNMGSGKGSTGNYFINTYSNHCPFVLDALNIEGCTFQHMIRGFVRIQGSKVAKIKSINCDGNLFYNCGYYDNNGRGYAWFAGCGVVESNIYTDFRFVNNTIYDSPRTCFITDNGKDLPWTAEDKWNITIENNTFINFSTRTSGRNIIDLRFVPGGSHFSIQRNLFALAKSSDDNRALNQNGADIRTICGSGIITFEVKDNYSTGCLDSHLQNDGIFTGGAFSARKNSFGAFETGNMGTEEDLEVKVGSTPLRTDELFVNPNPPYTAHDPSVLNSNDHVAPDNIMEALKYKQTPEVLNHEIYTKNIGDPRWKN